MEYSGWWRHCQVANLIGMVDQSVGTEMWVIRKIFSGSRVLGWSMGGSWKVVTIK